MVKTYHKDLGSLHIGCEKPRAYFIPYQSEEAALAGARENSDYFTSLCGEWNFKFYNLFYRKYNSNILYSKIYWTNF